FVGRRHREVGREGERMAVAGERLPGEEDLASGRAAAGGHLDELDRAIGVAEGLREPPQMNTAHSGDAAAEQNERAYQGPRNPRSRSHRALLSTRCRSRDALPCPSWRHN